MLGIDCQLKVEQVADDGAGLPSAVTGQNSQSDDAGGALGFGDHLGVGEALDFITVATAAVRSQWLFQSRWTLQMKESY